METLKAIARRKSTRDFTSEQISAASLTMILKAGCAAPVGMGRYDSLHLTVIQDKELLEAASRTGKERMGTDNDPLYHAPTLVIISAKPIPELPGIELANASCVAENMMLAATDAGISSVYLWGVPFALKQNTAFVERLGLPDGFQPVIAVALGYAAHPDGSEKELRVSIGVNTL